MNLDLTTTNIKRVSDEINYEIFHFPDDLIYVNYFDDATIDIHKIKEIKNQLVGLLKGKKSCSFVNFKNVYGTYTNEAKEFAAKDPELCATKKCEVLFTNTIQIKLLIKAYLSFNKPKFPTKVCSALGESFEHFRNYDCSDDDLQLLKKFLVDQNVISRNFSHLQ